MELRLFKIIHIWIYPNSPNLPTPDTKSDTLHHFQNLEQRLETSQARIRLSSGDFTQIVWLAQANGSVTNFNLRWYEYTGLTAVELLNWAFWQTIHTNRQDLGTDATYCKGEWPSPYGWWFNGNFA